MKRAGRALPGPTATSPAPEPVTVCNLCGCRAFDEVGHQVGMTTGLLFTYVRCTGCGLKFVSPRLTAEQNRALYSEDYFRGAGFDPAVHYVMLAEERALRSGESEGILGKIRLLKGSSSDLSILDAGCGTGAFLMALRAKGYRSLWGLDFSEFAARYTREATGATVLHGSLTDADFGDVRFDVINATEVIEHLRDPAAFFKRVGELLASGGIFVCSTGNATGLYARLLGRRWPYFHPEGHLYYFDPSTLATYFERAGLEVLSPTRTQQAELLRCEDLITNSQLAYMGASAPGMKGTIFHAAARVTRHVGVRAATLLQGKFALPIGVKR